MESQIIKPKIEIAQVMSDYNLMKLDTTWAMRIGRYDEENKYSYLV